MLNLLRTEGVEGYTLNSHGYRAPEFSTVDWTQSLAIFGCSFTFGEGLTDDADTIAAHLEHALGRPVINLGIPGASPMLMWALTTQLVDSGIRPRDCAYIWPSPNRVALFKGKDRHACWGPWTNDLQCNLGPWTWPNHGEEYFKLAKAAVGQAWHDVPTSHWTWNEHSFAHCGKFTGGLLKQEDFAQDKKHPGPKSTAKWAKILADVHL
jgi:hypothetical protein